VVIPRIVRVTNGQKRPNIGENPHTNKVKNMFQNFKDRSLKLAVFGSTLLASTSAFAVDEPIDFATLDAALAG